ncbi:DGQHR domain-containing protein [Deinobacterium chartae]|uniref:DGQHR domain-containing protein n=1 Tax=Deinobacterium chartae TaxID=521158 RepID=A0A841HUQ5_9DEIO|nr:DGQHR domain-containing protein [Deinobacterium chartae]
MDSQYKCLVTHFGGTQVYTFSMRVSDIIAISYVAARGKSNEDGAVQRILNTRRVTDIKNFVLEGNEFFNTFIINWTNTDILPGFDPATGILSIKIKPLSAQILDGQHRIKGLEAAITEKPDIGQRQILVSMCIGLSTKEAAQIFLNINTEQKPVPKSLIFDLFGEVVNDQEHAINRSKDIATELNENPESPYYRYIKFPGSPRGQGLIDLSTVVSSLKDSLKPDGIFSTLI